MCRLVVLDDAFYIQLVIVYLKTKNYYILIYNVTEPNYGKNICLY